MGVTSMAAKEALRRLAVLNHQIQQECKSGEEATLKLGPTATPVRAPLNKSLAKPFAPAKSDFFHLDDLLTPEEQEIRKKVRTFMATEVAPIINQYYETASFPFELLPKIRNLGILGGYCVKGYGCAGLTHLGVAALVIEMARVDASFATFVMVHNELAMRTLYLCGNEEQKQRFLPGMAKFDLVGAFALTEPDFGSDASSLETTARKVEGGWILNGEKRWIGNATFADLVIIWARNVHTNEINGFIVEKGAKGYAASKIENKIALRSVQNADITLTDCFVSEANRLGNAETFTGGVARVLAESRMMVSWQAVGIAMGIYDNALQYLKQRKQFGVPLASYQLLQEKLVRILGNVQAMILMAWRLSALHEAGKVTPGKASLAKAWNSLRLRECAALGREVLGGNGIVTDWHIARAFSDSEAIYTYEGTYEINTLVVGREITGTAAFKAGGGGKTDDKKRSPK